MASVMASFAWADANGLEMWETIKVGDAKLYRRPMGRFVSDKRRFVDGFSRCTFLFPENVEIQPESDERTRASCREKARDPSAIAQVDRTWVMRTRYPECSYSEEGKEQLRQLQTSEPALREQLARDNRTALAEMAPQIAAHEKAVDALAKECRKHPEEVWRHIRVATHVDSMRRWAKLARSACQHAHSSMKAT